jgi:phytoene dehydrogenase-like protein
MSKYDAVVVGGGPNGLAAAIVLARAGQRVAVLEAKETVGGGARTEELTLPGFRHDVCSAIHPMAQVSPFFRELELDVQWAFPPFAVAHPLDDGTAAVLEQSVDATAERFGPVDGRAWRRLMAPLACHAHELYDEILRPLRIVPHHPLLMAQFGLRGLPPATWLAKSLFRNDPARALFAGNSAHSFLPLTALGSASFGVVLALSGHATGWPAAVGGSSSIIDAMVRRLAGYGGEILTSHNVASLRDIPGDPRAILFDVTPRQLAAIAGDALPSGYVRSLRRFRYGPGVFKVDWALSGPIPWTAPECRSAATVHVGGTIDEIAAHEGAIWKGRTTRRPFVLVAQQSLFDPTRAPAGRHTGWAYCHVPHGSNEDMTEAIEAQIERFAPGFRDLVLARHTRNSAQYEAYDANFVGGDIAGGANNLLQVIMRPFPRLDPYTTPNERLFLCSSSTPPGGGVHGMCGYFGAQAALKRLKG